MTTSSPQRFWWLNPTLLTLILVLLVVSIGLQGGVINPSVEANRDETRSQGLTLAKVTCGVAQQTANAFTQRQVGPNDKLETLKHYLIRLQAQRYTLLAAIGADCPNAKGFPPFKVQLSRRLALLERILTGHGVTIPKPGENSEPAPGGGDASQPGSTGSQPSSPPSGGHPAGSGGGDTGGSGSEHHEASEAPAETPAGHIPAGITPEGISEEPAPEAAPEPSEPAAKQPIRETVAGVGETVNGALEGVGDTGCKLLGCKNP